MTEVAALDVLAVGRTLLAVAIVVAGAAAALCALHHLMLALAAWRGGPRAPGAGSAAVGSGAPSTRVTVLVPAHDEAAQIAACVRSLRAQDYPAGLLEVVVVADNCADDTAAGAAAAGARVLVRTDPGARGKGRALRWAIDRLLAARRRPRRGRGRRRRPEAAPDFLATLVRPFAAGAEAVQGESLLAEDGSRAAALRAAAFLLVNRVRPAGRAALGLPCSLCGNGMLLGRDLLRRLPWDAYSSAEDVEYTLHLRAAGVGVAFARGAVVRSPAAPNRAAAAQQELRWEGGRARLARTWIPAFAARGVRRRDASLLDAAVELALPPLGLLTAAVLAGTAGSALLAAAGATPALGGRPVGGGARRDAGLRPRRPAGRGGPGVGVPRDGGRRAAGRREGPARPADADLPRRHVGAHGACRPRAVAGGRRAASRPPASPPRASRPSPAARARRRRAGRAGAPASTTPSHAARRARPVQPAKGLHVDGNRLLDARGRVVVFHGVNRSGTEYACVQGQGIFDGPRDRRLGARDRALARQRRPGPAERELLARAPRRAAPVRGGAVPPGDRRVRPPARAPRAVPDALAHVGRARPQPRDLPVGRSRPRPLAVGLAQPRPHVPPRPRRRARAVGRDRRRRGLLPARRRVRGDVRAAQHAVRDRRACSRRST